LRIRNHRSVDFAAFFVAAVFAVAFSGSCSVPNLEAPECTESRGTVKEFYSIHFGNEMKYSPESLKSKEKFLTPELIASLAATPAGTDPFTTGSADLPKAFRVGGCTIADPSKTEVEIVLFWKDESRSEERKIHAEVVKRDDKWLINKILN